MKKAFAVVSAMLMMVFGNYQIYAQVLCQKSECCSCCPANDSGVSPFKCDFSNNCEGSKPQSASAVTVSKVFIRVFFSPVVIHSQVLNSILSGSGKCRPFKPDSQCISLAISTFQIPLRI